VGVRADRINVNKYEEKKVMRARATNRMVSTPGRIGSPHLQLALALAAEGRHHTPARGHSSSPNSLWASCFPPRKPESSRSQIHRCSGPCTETCVSSDPHPLPSVRSVWNRNSGTAPEAPFPRGASPDWPTHTACRPSCPPYPFRGGPWRSIARWWERKR
jgi:hypothetical protein